MQLRICCVSLFVVTVLAQYGNKHYRYPNFRNRWTNSYSTATPYVRHEIQELRKRWLGFYEYRPYFSRVIFNFPPLPGIRGPAVKNSYKEQSKSPMLPEKQENYYGATGFLDWQTEPFGPPKLMELEQQFSAGNSDSQEIEEEMVPVINTGAKQEDDFTDNSKENFNKTVVYLADENEDIDSEEKVLDTETEDDRENSDVKDVLDDDDKSKYPAIPSPDLVELLPEKSSGEISDDDAEQEVSVGSPTPCQPCDGPWDNPFDYFSQGRRPTDITHNSGQLSEVPDSVIFSEDPIYKFWNSEEEYNLFSDHDTVGLSSESPEAVTYPEESFSPVTSTTPAPETKVGGSSSNGPKSVYKHNYRKVPIDKDKRQESRVA